MSLLDELDNGGDEELRDAIQTVARAERDDAEWHNRGPDKNTHYELQFGGDGVPEAYVYVERYDPEKGVELMLWADVDWFSDEAREADWPDPEDADAPLGAFADRILETARDELDAEHAPRFEFHQHAPPSLVFTAAFYLN